MKNLVVAEFPAGPGKREELEATLRAALPDTRAFDGCRDIRTFYEPEAETFVLIEDWESFEHYDRYLAWRVENGLGELLDPLLAGGMAGFKVRRFQNTDI